jgi:spectinomycin phosphotransferase
LAELNTLSHRRADELETLWRTHQATIDRLARRARDLSGVLQSHSLPYTLCHGDIHTNNLLLTADERLYVIDWDEALMAPVERDLMFIIGGMVGGLVVRPADEAQFFAGYGPAQPDPIALAYYRYDWAMQDITQYAALVWLWDAEPKRKAEALPMLRAVLGPSNSVAAALRSEERLPLELRGT